MYTTQQIGKAWSREGGGSSVCLVITKSWVQTPTKAIGDIRKSIQS